MSPNGSPKPAEAGIEPPAPRASGELATAFRNATAEVDAAIAETRRLISTLRQQLAKQRAAVRQVFTGQPRVPRRRRPRRKRRAG